MKLFIVRHGETVGNVAGVVQGWSPGELTERGHQQAKQLAQQFNQEIDAIFASDLKRSRDTLQYFITRFSNIPVLLDWRLRERNFGQAEGKHRDEIGWDYYWSLRETAVALDSETIEEYDQRISSFIESIKSVRIPLDSILLVTHGGVINRIRNIVEPSHTYEPVENGTITEIII